MLCMLEPRSFSWQQCEIKGDVPSGRYAHSGNVVSLRGSKAEILVIMGGYGEAEEISNCYHISLPGFSSEKANEEAAAKLSRIGHSSLVVVDQLYFYGGWNGKKYLSYGGLYSPESSKTLVEKSKQRLLPRARRDHTLTLIGTKMFLFGGWNCKDQFNDLWMLNSAWEWKQIDVDGDIPSPRRGHSACAVGRNLFVFGGTQGFTKVEYYYRICQIG